MSILNLKNNALFLSCWYERLRPTQIICYLILLFSILFLQYITVFRLDYNAHLYGIMFLQMLILIVQGVLVAANLGVRERTSGTLNLHRNSPQPVSSKIFGLIFGSAWFEWCLFFGFFVLEIVISSFTDIKLMNIVLFNISLLLTGVFLHTVALMFSFGSISTMKNSIGSIFIIAFLLGSVFVNIFTNASFSFFSYLFGVPVIHFLFESSQTIYGKVGYFYMFKLPVLLMQVIVQLPLFLLMLRGLHRTFCLPNSSVWSKIDVLYFCTFLFFVMPGFFMDFNNIENIEKINLVETTGYYTNFYMVVYLLVGMFVSFFCVPTYFGCSKYVVLRQRKIKGKNIFDDGSTSLFTILSYIVIGAFFLFLYMLLIKFDGGNIWYEFSLNSIYILIFAGILEWFRLSDFRHNKIVLFTILFMWLIFIPWIFSLFGIDRYGFGSISSTVSPLLTLGLFIQSEYHRGDYPPLSIFIFPVIFMLIAWGAVYQSHVLIKMRSYCKTKLS